MNKKHLINYSDGSHIVCEQHVLDKYRNIGKKVVSCISIDKIQREAGGGEGLIYLIKTGYKRFSKKNKWMKFIIRCHTYTENTVIDSNHLIHTIAVHNTVASTEALQYKIEQCLDSHVTYLYGNYYELTKTAVDFICAIKDYEV